MRPVAGAILALATALSATPVAAAFFQRGVTLTPTSPTYVAVNDGAPPTGSAGVTVFYDSFSFTVDSTGSYQLTLSTSGGFKPWLTLYGGAFDPSSPLTNALVAQHYSTNQTGAFFTTTLSAGTVYTTALAGERLAPSANGNMSGVLSINGPGGVTPFAGASPTPEPATWASMILGLGLVGAAARRRRQAVA